MTEKTNTKFVGSALKESLLSINRVQSNDDKHQLEFVAEFKGLAYVNDAKSIRITATKYSLEAIETSVVLIIGGDDNDCDYSTIAGLIKQKVVAIVYLGKNSDKILKYCSILKLFFFKSASIEEAVQIATYVGQTGDVVLFSPACQCENENYIKRGNAFKKAVQELSV